MNATAELTSRWIGGGAGQFATSTGGPTAAASTTESAPASTTPNGQSLLTIDDSSSSTFYGQHLGLSLFDDSFGAINPGPPGGQLISFSDLGQQPQSQPPPQQQQHLHHHHHHHQPSTQHVHHVSQDQQQQSSSSPPSNSSSAAVSSSTAPGGGHPATSSQQTLTVQHEQLQRQQQQQQHLIQQSLPGQTQLSFNGLIPQAGAATHGAAGTIRHQQQHHHHQSSSSTTTTTTTNGVQQIFLNHHQNQLQQHQHQQQQILLQQQQQQLANLIQQQQQQQQLVAANHQLVTNGGHGVYNFVNGTTAANSVSGQFKVEPITDAALCLQEHFRQQQQQIALQTQLQLQYQLQQQQQQAGQGTPQLIDMGGGVLLQQNAMQLGQNFNLQFQGVTAGMVAAMAMQQQQAQQHQGIVIMGADGQTYHAAVNANGELEEYVEDDEEEEEEEGLTIEGGEENATVLGDGEGRLGGGGRGEEEDQEDEGDEGQGEHEDRETVADQMTVQLPMTTSSSSSNHCDNTNGVGGGVLVPGGGGLVIANGQPVGGGLGAYQQIGFYDRATGQPQGIFNQQLMFQHQQQLQQQRLPQGLMATNNGIQLLMPQSQSQQPQMIAYQQINSNNQQMLEQQPQILQRVPEKHVQQQLQNSMVVQQQQCINSGSNAGRKIRPVQKPGLILKTPIAFQGDVDPSEIPIQRDGMAVCERCGAIGVKHSFYTKFKSFCSLNCARNFEEEQFKRSQGNSNNFSNNHKSNNTGGDVVGWKLTPRNQLDQVRELKRINSQCGRLGFKRRFRMMGFDAFHGGEASEDDSLHGTDHKSGRYHLYGGGKDMSTDVLYRDLLPQEDMPELEDMPLICPEEDRIETVNRRKATADVPNTYDWSAELKDEKMRAAPVTCFRHVPGYEIWSKVVVNMKVEVENTDCDSSNQMMMGNAPHSFWVATVLRIQGYKALLRYEGFDDGDASHDFWVNLCSSEVHNVGWCATRGKPLIPPKSIEHKYSDWKQLLMQRLYNARTLSASFYNRLSESLKSRFRVGMQLEIVDKEKISRVRLATVEGIAGKRLNVRYNDNGDGFFCHEDSALIHHVGWASMVGHKIKAPAEYLARLETAAQDGVINYEEDDATVDLFRMNFSYDDFYLKSAGAGFREGMKLEAIDPLNPSSICVASVMSVLKFGYLMIRIDVYEPLVYGDDWFCYHEKSPYIFPVGFCQRNKVDLTPPKGYDAKTFNWDVYLKDTRTVAATEKLFEREVPKHNFEIGMKIECADLMDPKLVCVATVSRIVGRLLRINFDGWEDVYDQWLDIESPDMYPVGWCFLVKHRLEAPKMAEKMQPVAKGSKKRGRGKKNKGDGEGTSPGKTGAGKGNRGGYRMKAIKVEPVDDNEMSNSNNKAVNKKEKKLSEEESVKDIEMRNLDLEDSTSQFMGVVGGLEGHADEYSLSAVGGELMAMDDEGREEGEGEEEEEEEEEMGQPRNLPARTIESELLAGKKGRKPAKAKNTGSVSSSSSASSKTQKLMESILAENQDDEEEDEEEEQDDEPEEDEEMVGSSTHLEMDENPEAWTVPEVCQFLREHDCSAHCESFEKRAVDGKKLLKMSKDDIIMVLGMKVGPALKIFDLIQQLKDRIDPWMKRK